MVLRGHFDLIEVSFENTTAHWLHVTRVAFDFGDAERNAAVLVPKGADLEAWRIATLERNDIRDTKSRYHARRALRRRRNRRRRRCAQRRARGRRGGGAVALGTATAALVDDQDRRLQAAEAVRVAPRSHMLEVPFAIPPGLFTKKWILLQTPSRATPCISAMIIQYDVQDRGSERVFLRFRSELERSERQRRPWRPR